MKPLHIAASLRVVAKHRHMPGVSLVTARDIIRDLAAAGTLTHEDQQLVDELERLTGMPIAELAELTKRWPPGG